jgi:hypothetical protein
MAKNKDNVQESKQRGLFKKTRSGILLSKEEVKQIKKDRKKLRKELRKLGIRKKRDFELTASSMGLYFDKKRKGLLFWWWGSKALWAMVGAFVALLSVLFAASVVTQMRGHFTINLSEEMFKSGFTLSETIGFDNPTISLNSKPLENVPCTSISMIPGDVDDYEGDHHGFDYLAYSFYVRNEGDLAADYNYKMRIVSESQEVSKAIWIMIFTDGEMSFYAEIGADGKEETIPELSDNSHGYNNLPLMSQTANQDKQYQFITNKRGNDYYRIVPIPFESENIIVSGSKENFPVMGVHKYTVVIWAEGDDPECTDDIIGGHIGLDLNFTLYDEHTEDHKESSLWTDLKDSMQSIFDNLKFWE